MWLSALCIFAFALFPTFATANLTEVFTPESIRNLVQTKCDGVTNFDPYYKTTDSDQYIYATTQTYNTVNTKKQAHPEASIASSELDNKIFQCGGVPGFNSGISCAYGNIVLIGADHVFKGDTINNTAAYICGTTFEVKTWTEFDLPNCQDTSIKSNDKNAELAIVLEGKYFIRKKNIKSGDYITAKNRYYTSICQTYVCKDNYEETDDGKCVLSSSTSQSNTAPTKKHEPIKITSPETPSVSSIVVPGVGDECTTADLNERNATAGIYINNGNGVSCMATECRDNFYLVYQNGKSQGWCVASTFCQDPESFKLNILDNGGTDLTCIDTSAENEPAPTAPTQTTETEITETPIDTESTCDLTIQVTGENDVPISGATVKHGEETYTTDENGSATIRGIQTHTEFQINISHTDYKSTTYSGGPMDSCPDEPVVISLSAEGDDDTPPSPPQNNGDDNNDPDPTEPDVDLESQRQIDQARIDELQENADAMREREQSLANRMIGGASMGAMGIGGMQVASALAEQSADDAAELDMTAYLATFRCDYGAGQNIRGGETNITLPGANILLPLYNEYTTLAADLKSRKESLGMAPGIESETILDATLYDNESIGITDGAYTSLSRALSNPTGADAAEWAAQRAETAEQLKTGAIVAGVGAAVGIAGNILTNYVGDQPRERSAEINAKYDALRDELRAKLKPIERESETAAIQTAPEIESGKENTPEVKPTPTQPSAAKTACTQNGGTWADNTCDCGTGKTWNSDTNNCTENEKPTPSNPELITINNAALFKYGSYDVGTQNETLDEVINQLSNADFTNNPAKLVLVAHTDSDGIKYGGTLWNDGIKTNEQLGQKRADAVKGYIEKNWTNKPTNVTISAWSAGDSCADKNATDEQKKGERKVVFYLFYDNQTDDMSNLETLRNNKCSTFNTAASSAPPIGSITSNTDINDADTTELITAAQNCDLDTVQNLIGNSNFEITAEITRAYQAVAQKFWNSDHEPSNSCYQTNDFIAKKIYNKLKEYIDANDVASMKKFANLPGIADYENFEYWISPYSEEIIKESHADDVAHTDNLLYYTIDKDSEDIFKLLVEIGYLDWIDFGDKSYAEIILLFPNTNKALKYTNLYANLHSQYNPDYYIEDEVFALCGDDITDPVIRALEVGNFEIFKWCLDNSTIDEIDPDDFYFDTFTPTKETPSVYTFISEQCNNDKQIYCEAKEYSEQWMCDTIKKYPEDFTITDFDGLTCN